MWVNVRKEIDISWKDEVSNKIMSELIIKNIHPLNAEYLLSTEPHRFYLDEGGNILELTVRRFSHLVVEKLYEHGGVIVA